MYDPSAARWLSEDPIGFEGEDTNLYRYAGNNPTNNTDPSGLQPPKQDIPSPHPPVHPGPPPKVPDNTMTRPGNKDRKYLSESDKYNHALQQYNDELAEYERQVSEIKKRRKGQISWRVDVVPAVKPGGDDIALQLSRLYAKHISCTDYVVEPKNLEDFIAKLNEVTNNGFAKIRRLVFRMHGGCSGGGSITLGFGKEGVIHIELSQIDPMSPTYNPAVVRLLEKLRDMLTDDAKVILWTCSTGSDSRFMQLLSNILLVEVEGLDIRTDDYLEAVITGKTLFENHWHRFFPSNPPPNVGKPGKSKPLPK